MKLDEKGRCCGRKPIHYKGGAWNSPAQPEKFCSRCDRAYSPITGEQIANWAWIPDPVEGFVRKNAKITNDALRRLGNLNSDAKS